ncbi:RAxF-45 family protein [Sutcliffiella cohnii]
MLNAVLMHGFTKEFLYFVRAKFAFLVVDGIRMSIFSN